MFHLDSIWPWESWWKGVSTIDAAGPSDFGNFAPGGEFFAPWGQTNMNQEISGSMMCDVMSIYENFLDSSTVLYAGAIKNKLVEPEQFKCEDLVCHKYVAHSSCGWEGCEALSSLGNIINQPEFMKQQCSWKRTRTFLNTFGMTRGHQGWSVASPDFIKSDS